MPASPRRKHEWTDEYTLLCEDCGYIIEDLDQSLPCPECGLPILASQPEIRRVFEWKGYSKITDLIEMARLSLLKPQWLLQHTRLHEYLSSNLRSYWVLIAVGIFAAMTALITVIKDEWFMGFFAFPLAMFQVWINICLYSWLGRLAFAYIAKKRGKRMHPELSITIFNYACIGWVISSLGAVLSAPAIAIADLNGWNTSLRVLHGIGLTIFFLGIGYIIYFLYLGYKHAGYANRVRSAVNVQTDAMEG